LFYRFPETPCNSGYYFSSVIGDGKVLFIEDTHEKCAALNCMFKHPSGKDEGFHAEQANAVCVFKIVFKSFSGKRKITE
jgi:nitroimidazol reductase NimA-like FMN-containing flavoprotein (pyridoxamine 5'-phosphate oxidase superfamily)